MENKKFQFNIGGQTIITFAFFSLISFVLVFFLGVLVGKNSALVIQEIVFSKPAVEKESIKKQPPTNIQKNEEKSSAEVSKQESVEKSDTKEKPTIKKNLAQKTSQETEDLFGENHYVIQVIAYKSKAKAENLQGLLKKNFYPAYINGTIKDGVSYHRVRIGSYSLKEAKRVQQDLQKEFSNLRNTKIFSIK